MRIVVEVISIDGGLPDFLGASCSGNVLCSISLHVHVSSSERCEEITIYHTANCLSRHLDSCGYCDWFSRLLGCLRALIGPSYIASARTEQRTPPLTVPLLLRWARDLVFVETCLQNLCQATDVISGSAILTLSGHVTIYSAIIPPSMPRSS
jgi:hypothetical protein